jgi:large subunit ribosomal protein L23
MNTVDVIIKPIMTELAIKEARDGKYTFAVAGHADKKIIKKAIEAAFAVHAVRIQTRIMKGKTKRAGLKRTIVRQTIWKKATVTVQSGEKIPLFEPGGTEDEK